MDLSNRNEKSWESHLRTENLRQFVTFVLNFDKIAHQ